MRGTSKIVTVVAFFLVAGLAACGGGGGGSTTPPVNPPPSQAPVPGPTGSGTPAPKPTFSTTPGPSGNPSSPPSGNPSAPPSGTPSAPPTTPVPTPPTTPPPTPVPTPVVTPTPVQTATPQPTITPFAKSWVIAGEGATPKPGALDNGFKATNNAFDNRTTTKNEGSDGDLSPGDPGAIPAGGGQGPVGNTVDNISCDVSMSDNYHVHAFIGLYYNGQQVVIPDAIGIVHAAGDQVDPVTGWPNQEVYGDCFYHIHTHDDTGMIHLEDPDPTGATINDSIFTTGNLFDIWGVQVNMAQFGPFSGPVTIYTSGQFSRANQCTGTGQSSICEVGSNMYTQYFGDPMSIPIYSHEVIWFLVGSGNPDVAHLPGVSFATPK